MKKIVLVGYMGSGKTTVGKKLAEITGLPFYDLDEIIEKKTGKTITELFLELGEIKFRKMEHEAVSEFFITRADYVLSMGGGTPCYANNYLYLRKDNVTSVYLKASVEVIVDRIRGARNTRPLISSMKDSDVEKFIRKHLFERSYFYLQSRYLVNVDGKSALEIAEEIKMLN